MTKTKAVVKVDGAELELEVPNEPHTPKNAAWDELVADFKAGKIHMIRRWSGKAIDEDPVCGDTSAEASNHRTSNASWVSCPKCISAMRKAKLQVVESSVPGIFVVLPSAAIRVVDGDHWADVSQAWWTTGEKAAAEAFRLRVEAR